MFVLPIERCQPSQFYLSKQKVDAVRTWFSIDRLEPLPVKRVGDTIFLTDGHSRAFVAYEKGVTELSLFWDTDDWPFYEDCVRACQEQGIFSIPDLAQRQLSPEEFEEKWLGFCRKLSYNDKNNDCSR